MHLLCGDGTKRRELAALAFRCKTYYAIESVGMGNRSAAYRRSFMRLGVTNSHAYPHGFLESHSRTAPAREAVFAPGGRSPGRRGNGSKLSHGSLWRKS